MQRSCLPIWRREKTAPSGIGFHQRWYSLSKSWWYGANLHNSSSVRRARWRPLAQDWCRKLSACSSHVNIRTLTPKKLPHWCAVNEDAYLQSLELQWYMFTAFIVVRRPRLGVQNIKQLLQADGLGGIIKIYCSSFTPSRLLSITLML